MLSINNLYFIPGRFQVLLEVMGKERNNEETRSKCLKKKFTFPNSQSVSGILWRFPERAGLCVQGFNPGQSRQGSLPESLELTSPSEEVSSGPLTQIGWNPNTLGPESSGRAMRSISLAESEVSRRRKKLAAPSARGLRRSHPKGAAKASRGTPAASQAPGSGGTSA